MPGTSLAVAMDFDMLTPVPNLCARRRCLTYGIAFIIATTTALFLAACFIVGGIAGMYLFH